MAGDPRADLLVAEGLGVGEVARPERRDEDRGFADLAAFAIDDRHLGPGPVHEELLAGAMLKAHRDVERAAPAPIQVAETRVRVSVIGMLGSVLVPEQLQRDTLARLSSR